MRRRVLIVVLLRSLRAASPFFGADVWWIPSGVRTVELNRSCATALEQETATVPQLCLANPTRKTGTSRCGTWSLPSRSSATWSPPQKSYSSPEPACTLPVWGSATSCVRSPRIHRCLLPHRPAGAPNYICYAHKHRVLASVADDSELQAQEAVDWILGMT